MRASFSAAKAWSVALQSCACRSSAVSSLKRLRRQVQERRVGIRRMGKLRHVEGKQAAAVHMDAVARMPFAENRIELINLPRRDSGVECFGNAVGEHWDAEPNATAGRFSSEQPRPLSAATALPLGSNQEQVQDMN